MMKNKKNERIIIDIAIFLCIFLIPSYFTLIICSLFVIRYRRYIEFPVVAFLIDVVYKTSDYAYIGLFGCSLILLTIVELIRDIIKIRPKETL